MENIISKMSNAEIAAHINALENAVATIAKSIDAMSALIPHAKTENSKKEILKNVIFLEEQTQEALAYIAALKNAQDRREIKTPAPAM